MSLHRASRRRLTACLLLSATLVVASCSSDDASDGEGAIDGSATTEATDASPVGSTGDASTTEAPSTTSTSSTTTTTEPPAPAVTPEELAASGPYEVGVTTRAIPGANAVEVWYPADAGTAGGTDTYNVRQFLPEGVAALVPPEIQDTFTIDATRDAAPAADGPYPLVLFSHGSTSFRLQSSALAQHLASWGMVVASTDHSSRSLLNVIGGTAEGQPAATDEMRAMRTYLGALDADPVLAGVVDAERVALGGHSAGGSTVAALAAEDAGILGYVSYASGLFDGAAPDVPSLFMAGELDTIVDPIARTQDAFDRAASPSWLWSFAESGHLAFADLCRYGADETTNLITLAEAAGLSALVDDRLRALGTDGCLPPNRPVAEVQPGIFQASTGFYRWVFGIDAEPIGLDESVVTDGVTVTAK
jgi:dienelactone hydrolase